MTTNSTTSSSLKMRVRPFSEEKDLGTLAQWVEKWGIPIEFVTIRSPEGFVAGTDRKLVMGFMTKTDAKVASLTNLIGDPEASQDDRKEGVKAVLLATEKKAREEGFKVLSVSTNIEAVEKGLDEAGFKMLDQNLKVFGKGL